MYRCSCQHRGYPAEQLKDVVRRGDTIELAIQQWYKSTHPLNEVLLGAQTRLGENLELKPDIFDKTAMKWMEIKPLSAYGIASGKVQHAAYTANFTPLGYSADERWIPLPQPMQIIGYSIWVFNVSGILFYTDFSVRDLLKIPAVVTLGYSLHLLTVA
jgi:hypothetical protein